jgi:hypothetical protein
LADDPVVDDVCSQPASDDAPRSGGRAVGLTGARFRPIGQAPAEPPLPVDPPEPEVSGPSAEVAPEAVGRDVDLPPGVAPVRPYVLTRGRTRPPVDLPLETLVTVGPAAARCAGTAQAALVELCRGTRSVAEVAALAGLPLGVVRVLVGDLAATGVLVVQRTVYADGPDLALLGRVLTGLRNL